MAPKRSEAKCQPKTAGDQEDERQKQDGLVQAAQQD
jgi:hypothetical protein